MRLSRILWIVLLYIGSQPLYAQVTFSNGNPGDSVLLVTTDTTPDCSIEVEAPEVGLRLDRQLPVIDGTVGLWHLDEGKGTIAKDNSGHGNDGILNLPVWTQGIDGSKALKFRIIDGVGDIVEVPHSQSLNLNWATFEFWVKRETEEPVKFLQKSDGCSGYLIGANGGLKPQIWDTDGILWGDEKHGTVPVGEWTFCAVTYDSTMVVYYVNGIKAGEEPASGKPIGPNDYSLVFGRDILVFETRTPRYLDGVLDEVRIVNRSLSSDEIACDYFVAAYSYSIDRGVSWSDWRQASYTGESGSKDWETITAHSVPFNQYSEDKNLIKFMIADLDGRIIISKPYKVVIRKE